MRKALLISLTVIPIALAGAFAVYAHRAPQASTQSVTPTATTVQQAPPEELLRLVNIERSKIGVAALTLDPAINATAQRKADQVYTDKTVGHIDKNGVHGYMYMKEAGIKCSYGGENIVTNDSMMGKMSADDAVLSWINSKAHHDAMIDPKYNTTGFGVRGWVVVEHFCVTE